VLAWSLSARCPSVYTVCILLRVLRMAPSNQLSGVRSPRKSTDAEPHEGDVRLLEVLHWYLQLVVPPDLLYSSSRRFHTRLPVSADAPHIVGCSNAV